MATEGVAIISADRAQAGATTVATTRATLLKGCSLAPANLSIEKRCKVQALAEFIVDLRCKLFMVTTSQSCLFGAPALPTGVGSAMPDTPP